MEVKQNKTNGQKYVSIPKDSNLQEGDKVNISKVLYKSKSEIEQYWNENKEKMSEFLTEVYNYIKYCFSYPEYEFLEFAKKKFNIKEENIEGVCDLRCGNVQIECDYYTAEIYEHENFYDAEGQDFEHTILKSEVVNLDGEEEEEVFGFNEELYPEQELENMRNSAILLWYSKLQTIFYKQKINIIAEGLKDFGFEFSDSMSNGEDGWIYYNKEENIYMKVGANEYYPELFYLVLFSESLSGDEYLEIDVEKELNL